MPKSTQEAIFSSKRAWEWLEANVKISVVKVYDYAAKINYYLKNDRKLAVAFVHFLYHSLSKNHLSKREVEKLCHSMPIADNYGNLTTQRKGVLVPAKGSKWVGLVGSNPWRGEGYVELGEDYLHPDHFAGEHTSGDQVLNFLKTYVAASDIPDISPPNAAIPAVSAPLTNENAFLLLDWIRNLKLSGTSIPENFLKSIKEGSWLKITTNYCSGYRPPYQSFMFSGNYRPPYQSFMFSSWLGKILQKGSVLADIPLIDQNFYGDRINEYEEELKTIGVKFQYGEACDPATPKVVQPSNPACVFFIIIILLVAFFLNLFFLKIK
jgi:hypothetical protein